MCAPGYPPRFHQIEEGDNSDPFSAINAAFMLFAAGKVDEAKAAAVGAGIMVDDADAATLAQERFIGAGRLRELLKSGKV